MSEYLTEFVQESEESITELNNALLDLERSPDDEAAMDRVFRTAHTLKGNCGAMGFDDASDLAHAIEDVLDAVRAGRLEVTPELMDRVFDGVDTLEAMLDEVADGGDTRTDPTATIEALRSELDGLAVPTDDEVREALAGVSTDETVHDLFHVRVAVEEGTSEAVLSAVEDAFDVLDTPDADPDATVLEVVFASAVGEGAIEAALDPVEVVEEFVVTPVEDDLLAAAADPPDPTDAGSDGDERDPDEMSVDELLGEFEMYDDLDEAVDQVDDVEGLENMGQAGAFDDIVDGEVGAPEAAGDADAETADAGAGPESGDEPDPHAEPDDVQGTFAELQEEYDQVGLGEMEAELEDVEFGEYDDEEEVGFDELLDEEDLSEFDHGEEAPDTATSAGSATTGAEAPDTGEAEPTVPSVAEPDETAVEAALEGIAAGETDAAYHVRLPVAPGSGAAALAAVEDAFEVLAVPDREAVVAGEYEYVDAVFGSDVDESVVVAALDGVDGVGEPHMRAVTDRLPEPDPVDAGAGTESGDEPDPHAEPDDVQGTFAELQDEYDQVGLGEMEAELEDVEFGEYDDEEEVGFDELLDEEDLSEFDHGEEAPDAATSAGSATTGAEAPDAGEAPDTGEAEPAVPSVAEPDETAVEAALEGIAAGEAETAEFVRVPAAPESGAAVLAAVEDAFEVLAVPDREAVVAGEYEYVDVVVAGDADGVAATLASAAGAGDPHVRTVTDRLPAAEPEPESTAAGTDPAADGVDDESEPADVQGAFSEMKDEFDRVGIDEMESELEGVQFGEFDDDDEVGFDELLGEEFDEFESATPEPTADAGGEPTAAEESAPPTVDADDDMEDVAVSEFEAGGVDDVEVSEFEAGDDLGDVEVSEFGVADEVAVDESEFGVADEVDVDGEEFGVADAVDDLAVDEVAVDDSAPPEASDPVTDIKGIGENYERRLADAGVETVGDLVTADADAVAEETDLATGRLEEWVERAPITAADVAGTTTGEGADATTGAATGETTQTSAGTADAGAGEASASVGTGTGDPDDSTGGVDTPQSVRVDVDRVDSLLTLVEEMVTSRARLRRAIDEGAPRERLDEELEELDVISSELQDEVMEMRLVPIETVTQRLPRIVRDISREQDKRVRFETEGEDVEIDRSILDRLGDPLIHIVRNAVDHGLEPPEQRAAAGKPEEGRVTLRASRARDMVVVEVEDDGRGLDADDLREEAVENGVLEEAAAAELSDEDAYELVFESGLSTNEEVTDVSGRGVGMDVVARTVEELDGEVEVESTPGEGTTIRMRLPVSVAISEVLFVESGGEEYGIPIKVVDEIGAMATAEAVADGGRQVRADDGVERELLDLAEALDTPASPGGDDGMMITVEEDVRPVAIRCDAVRGQQEVVVKPFEGLLSGIPGLSGAAVLGEGDVVNILDVETL